jgi:hypothetical protein
MAEESISLKPFLLGDPPNKALSECAAAAAAALNTGLVGLGALDWAGLATEIGEKLEQMFDIRLSDVLAAAWKDYQALTDCADRTKHPADETIRLPMVDHRIETILRPCLDVTVGARPPIRIVFEITLALELNGLVLNIQDSAIRAIRIGSCRAKASVKCEKVTLIERATKELDLPGRIVLPHGIPIAPPRATTTRTSDDEERRSRFTVVPGTRAADSEPLSALPI